LLTFDHELATAALCRSDRPLARLIRKTGPYSVRPERMQRPFDALLRAIVYQQLSGKAAATILGRVQALFPKGRPTPELLLALPDESLRGAGLSRAKVAAVKDLAAKSLDGVVPTLARLRRMDDEQIVERLTQVRGIGRWSVEMLLIFRMGRPDVLPVADLGVRKGFMLTYGLKEMPTVGELTAHAERWRPYRSVGSWYMWRALDGPKK
jgi:DNA-3-methyladenine glycosylase II